MIENRHKFNTVIACLVLHGPYNKISLNIVLIDIVHSNYYCLKDVYIIST